MHNLRPKAASAVPRFQRDSYRGVRQVAVIAAAAAAAVRFATWRPRRLEGEVDVPQDLALLFVLNDHKEGRALAHRFYRLPQEPLRSRGVKVLDKRPSLDDGVAPQVQECPLVGRDVRPQDGATSFPPRTRARERRNVHAKLLLVLPELLLSGFGGICLVGKGLWEVFLSVTGWHTQIFAAESVSALYLSVGCGRSVHERNQAITDHVHFPGDWI